mgnify:CR=1 FL=1
MNGRRDSSSSQDDDSGGRRCSSYMPNLPPTVAWYEMGMPCFVDENLGKLPSSWGMVTEYKYKYTYIYMYIYIYIQSIDVWISTMGWMTIPQPCHVLTLAHDDRWLVGATPFTSMYCTCWIQMMSFCKLPFVGLEEHFELQQHIICIYIHIYIWTCIFVCTYIAAS